VVVVTAWWGVSQVTCKVVVVLQQQRAVEGSHPSVQSFERCFNSKINSNNNNNRLGHDNSSSSSSSSWVCLRGGRVQGLGEIRRRRRRRKWCCGVWCSGCWVQQGCQVRVGELRLRLCSRLDAVAVVVVVVVVG
jgi:hypothetical protein